MLGPHGYIVQLNCSAGRLLLLASCLQQRQRQQHVLAPAAQVAPLLLLMLLVCSTQQLPSLNLGPAAAAAAAAPTLDLALWNQAYQLIVEDIPVRPDPPTAHAASQISSAAADDPSNWDTALSIPSSCSSSGYDTIDPASVPLNACFYKVALRSNGASNGVAAAARAAAAVAHAVPPAAAALASAQSGVSNTTKSSNTWQQASHLQLGSNSDAGSSSSSGRRLLAYSDSNKTVSYWQKLAGDLRRNTNCYCYALDLRQNGFCTPGASTGEEFHTEKVYFCASHKHNSKGLLFGPAHSCLNSLFFSSQFAEQLHVEGACSCCPSSTTKQLCLRDDMPSCHHARSPMSHVDDDQRYV
jgi:hypothetical protein